MPSLKWERYETYEDAEDAKNCVYILADPDQVPVYVGKATHFGTRYNAAYRSLIRELVEKREYNLWLGSPTNGDTIERLEKSLIWDVSRDVDLYNTHYTKRKPDKHLGNVNLPKKIKDAMNQATAKN